MFKFLLFLYLYILNIRNYIKKIKENNKIKKLNASINLIQ